MKKLFIIIAVLASTVLAQAQNYATMYMDSIQSGDFHYCSDEVDGLILYRGEPNCTSWYFVVNDEVIQNVESIVLDNSEWYNYVVYHGCQYIRYMDIYFETFDVQNPFAEPIIWKHPWESVVLNAPHMYGCEVHWYNDSTGYEIEVTEPDTCSVTITNIYGCGSEIFSVCVYDNIEIYRAGSDYLTGRNKITWIVDPAMASVYDSVKVMRDVYIMAGCVPYQDGEFIDNITSDDRSHMYQIFGILPDGTECPIISYKKGTPYCRFEENLSDSTLYMAINLPYIEGGQSTLAYFNVYKYTGSPDLIPVDTYIIPGSGDVYLTSYSLSNFYDGQAIIGFVFIDRRGHEQEAFTNLSMYITNPDGINENEGNSFKVYPNPVSSGGIVTIEGATRLTISNTIGQTVYESYSQDGTHRLSIEYPGIYFIKSYGVETKKLIIK